MKLTLALFFVTFQILAASDFPANYTPEDEKDIKSWMKVRVEGKPSSYLKSPFTFIGYTIKAMKKKFSAPKEELSYLKNQLKVLESLPLKSDNAQTLTFVGDLMWLREGWSDFLDPKLHARFSKTDFLFGNLETLISKSNKVPTFLPARATFNSKKSLLTEFSNAKGRNYFSALSIANNHSYDYGDEAMKETTAVLKEESVPFSGVMLPPYDKRRWVKVKKGNLSVGFYAATYGMNNQWEKETKLDYNLLKGFAPYSEEEPSAAQKVDLSEIKQVIAEMKEAKVDIKVISLHWGFEYEYYPSPRQVSVAQEISALGADIIMGHHAHAQQPLDICYVDREAPEGVQSDCVLTSSSGDDPHTTLIIYGLGNFLTNMYGFLSEVGMMVDISVKKGESGLEFFRPSVDLVYNDRDDERFKQERSLRFINDYLSDHCNEHKCENDDMKDLKFLESHYGKLITPISYP